MSVKLSRMNKQHDRPSLWIILKYILLQLPGQVAFAFILILFRHWLEAPAYLTWGLLGFWVGNPQKITVVIVLNHHSGARRQQGKGVCFLFALGMGQSHK